MEKIEEELVISDVKLPPFDLVVRCYLNHYLKKMKLHMLPSSRWRYLVFVIEFLHLLIGAGAFTLGIFLPPALLPYNILFISFVLIGWKLLGYCWVTKIVGMITGKKEVKLDDCASTTDDRYSQFLIPVSENFLMLYGLFIVALSVFFYMKPQHAPFNIIKSIVMKLYSLLKFE
jgi:hypothetical protein